MKNNARVLVIHSSAVMRYMIKRCFGGLGYGNTILVADGGTGLVQLDNFPFELVLFDCDLPDMGGIGLLRVIRSDPVLSALPVILMVGNDDRGVEREAWRYGIDGFVKRPTNETILKTELAGLLGCLEPTLSVRPRASAFGSRPSGLVAAKSMKAA